MTVDGEAGVVTLRAPGRGVLLGAAVLVAGLVNARILTRSGGPAFDDWFFLALADALLVAALLWSRCRIDLIPGGVRVVNGVRILCLASTEVTALDMARLGDRGDRPRVPTSIRVPIGVRLVVHGGGPTGGPTGGFTGTGTGGTYLTVYGLAPDSRTRRDPQRWAAYLAQVDTVARHLGVPFNATADGP